MDKSQSDKIHKKLSMTIAVIFNHTDCFYLNDEELKNIFFDNLSGILKIAFDLNLDIKKLEEFNQRFKNKATVIDGARFLVETLENKDTYILLNYYYYRFIQLCLETRKGERIEKIEKLMDQTGINEFDTKKIKADYENLVFFYRYQGEGCSSN